jgi:[acyl-carrier-protein] S-malonyltransferase
MGMMKDSEKNAWVFPGQGSQVLGMGVDLWNVPTAKARFEQAERILGWSVFQVGDRPEQLLRTSYCQPAIFAISTILADLVRENGNVPDYVAGYSLGEYTALYVAGVLDFETGLRLLQHRGQIMDAAPPGGMVAAIGCDRILLQQYIDNIPDVELINDDPNQFVISGSHSAIATIANNINARKIVPLMVSKPFHTQLMRPVELAYQKILDEVTFKEAQIPILSNLDPTPTVNPLLIKDRLRQQMTHKIRWLETIGRFGQEGVTTIIEIGPSMVLTPQLKRGNWTIALKNVTNLADALAIATPAAGEIFNGAEQSDLMLTLR